MSSYADNNDYDDSFDDDIDESLLVSPNTIRSNNNKNNNNGYQRRRKKRGSGDSDGSGDDDGVNANNDRRTLYALSVSNSNSNSTRTNRASRFFERHANIANTPSIANTSLLLDDVDDESSCLTSTSNRKSKFNYESAMDELELLAPTPSKNKSNNNAARNYADGTKMSTRQEEEEEEEEEEANDNDNDCEDDEESTVVQSEDLDSPPIAPQQQQQQKRTSSSFAPHQQQDHPAVQSSSDIHLRSWELAETLHAASSTGYSPLTIRALDDDNDESSAVLLPVEEEVEIRAAAAVMPGLGPELSAETPSPGSESSNAVLAEEDSAELCTPPPTTTTLGAATESSTKVTTTAAGLAAALAVAADASCSALQAEEGLRQPSSSSSSSPAVRQPRTSKSFSPKAEENDESNAFRTSSGGRSGIVHGNDASSVFRHPCIRHSNPDEESPELELRLGLPVNRSYDQYNHTLPPGGRIARDVNGDANGGLATSVNDANLSMEVDRYAAKLQEEEEKAREGVQILGDGDNDRLDDNGGVDLAEMVGVVVGSGAPASLKLDDGVVDVNHGPKEEDEEEELHQLLENEDDFCWNDDGHGDSLEERDDVDEDEEGENEEENEAHKSFITSRRRGGRRGGGKPQFHPLLDYHDDDSLDVEPNERRRVFDHSKLDISRDVGSLEDFTNSSDNDEGDEDDDKISEGTKQQQQRPEYVERMNESIASYFSNHSRTSHSASGGDETKDDSFETTATLKHGDNCSRETLEADTMEDDGAGIGSAVKSLTSYTGNESGGVINLSAMGSDASQIDVEDTLEYVGYVQDMQRSGRYDGDCPSYDERNGGVGATAEFGEEFRGGEGVVDRDDDACDERNDVGSGKFGEDDGVGTSDCTEEAQCSEDINALQMAEGKEVMMHHGLKGETSYSSGNGGAAAREQEPSSEEKIPLADVQTTSDNNLSSFGSNTSHAGTEDANSPMRTVDKYDPEDENNLSGLTNETSCTVENEIGSDPIAEENSSFGHKDTREAAVCQQLYGENDVAIAGSDYLGVNCPSVAVRTGANNIASLTKAESTAETSHPSLNDDFQSAVSRPSLNNDFQSAVEDRQLAKDNLICESPSIGRDALTGNNYYTADNCYIVAAEANRGDMPQNVDLYQLALARYAQNAPKALSMLNSDGSQPVDAATSWDGQEDGFTSNAEPPNTDNSKAGHLSENNSRGWQPAEDQPAIKRSAESAPTFASDANNTIAEDSNSLIKPLDLDKLQLEAPSTAQVAVDSSLEGESAALPGGRVRYPTQNVQGGTSAQQSSPVHEPDVRYFENETMNAKAAAQGFCDVVIETSFGSIESQFAGEHDNNPMEPELSSPQFFPGCQLELNSSFDGELAAHEHSTAGELASDVIHFPIPRSKPTLPQLEIDTEAQLLGTLSENLSPIKKSSSPHSTCDLPQKTNGNMSGDTDGDASINQFPMDDEVAIEQGHDSGMGAPCKTKHALLDGDAKNNQRSTDCDLSADSSKTNSSVRSDTTKKASIFQVLSQPVQKYSENKIDEPLGDSLENGLEQPALHGEHEVRSSFSTAMEKAHSPPNSSPHSEEFPTTPESGGKRKSIEDLSCVVAAQQNLQRTSSAFLERLQGAAENRKREVTRGRYSMERKEQILYEEKKVRAEMPMPAVDEDMVEEISSRSAVSRRRKKMERDDPYKPFKARPVPTTTTGRARPCTTAVRVPKNTNTAPQQKSVAPVKSLYVPFKARHVPKMSGSRSSATLGGSKRKSSTAFRPHMAQNKSHVKQLALNAKPPKRMVSGKDASIAKEMSRKKRLQEEEARINRQSVFKARPLPTTTATKSQGKLVGEDLVPGELVRSGKENTMAFVPRSSVRAEERALYDAERGEREHKQRRERMDRRNQIIDQNTAEVQDLKKFIR